MLSDKPVVRNVVETCAAKGIEHVIISPGSRNAPLIISFNEHGAFKCLSIPDERVAAYFALGIAQQTRKPVIITCTSGTASLNFAPAIAEAFYQKIPLLIITADRPVEWIHQGEGQSINQRSVFSNYVKRSYQLPQEAKDKDGLWSTNRMVSEAIDATYLEGGGPVHLNIPFQEPLYGQKDYASVPLPKTIKRIAFEKILSNETLQDLGKVWGKANKKMILCGLLPLDKELQKLIENFEKDADIIVLAETTSNIITDTSINQIDVILGTIDDSELKQFQPDLLITIGGSFISKKIKHFIRKNGPNQHWHIEENNEYIDTFQSLTTTIPISPTPFFKQLSTFFSQKSSYPHSYQHNYRNLWLNRQKEVLKKHQLYLHKIEWSDLTIFDIILPTIPKNTNVHLANSTPVRYVQMFEADTSIHYNSNRGVAGIDGSTSTAAGAAFVNNRLTILITGDISFFYDSNAFWHHHLSSNLRVILINNGGGNIFRYIPGPPTTQQLDTYFEAQHQLNAKHIAKTFNLAYSFAKNEAELKEMLLTFFEPQSDNRAAILEIKTPNEESAAVLRGYFRKTDS